MPLYDYGCKKCGINGIELNVALSDYDKPILCRDVMTQFEGCKAECSGCDEVLSRQLSPVRFRFA